MEVEFSEFFDQIRFLNDNQSESEHSQPVPGLLINSAGNEVVKVSSVLFGSVWEFHNCNCLSFEINLQGK